MRKYGVNRWRWQGPTGDQGSSWEADQKHDRPASGWPAHLDVAMGMARGIARRIGADPDEAEADMLAAYAGDERRRADIEAGGSHAWTAVRAAGLRGQHHRQPAGLRRANDRWVRADARSLDDLDDDREWWRLNGGGEDQTGETAATNVDLERAFATMDEVRRWSLIQQALGRPQAEIAAEIGCTQSMVSHICAGTVAQPGRRRVVDATVKNRVALAQQAVEAETPIQQACREVGLSTATYYRHGGHSVAVAGRQARRAAVESLIDAGMTMRAACAEAGVSESTYRMWRREAKCAS